MKTIFTAVVGMLVRHLKRGSYYTTTAIAELQCSTPPKEGDLLVIYKPTVPGKVYARPKVEFEDGRFSWEGAEAQTHASAILRGLAPFTPPKVIVIGDGDTDKHLDATSRQIVAEAEELLGGLLADNLILTHDAMHAVRKLFNRCQAVENERARQLVNEAQRNAL